MIAVIATPLWHARGPRFLALLILLWISVRIAASWPVPPVPFQSPVAAQAIAVRAAVTVAVAKDQRRIVAALARPAAAMHRRPALAELSAPPSAAVFVTAAAEPPFAVGAAADTQWSSLGRHRLRFAMLDGVLPKPYPAHRAALTTASRRYFPPGSVAPPPTPSWPKAREDRWSLALYSYWRAGSGAPAPLGIGPRAMLGGSQTAARVDYALSGNGRIRAFARFAASPGTTQHAEVALGLTARPFAKLPVDLHIEHRLALIGGGRGRTLAYVSGGVDRMAVSDGFTVSGYAQGGIAGNGSVEAFADAAIAIQRPIFEEKALRLSVGAMLAGAAQRDAQRIDAGPRATVDLPLFGKGAQISLDWRERVAGNARPNDGLALTVSAGF